MVSESETYPAVVLPETAGFLGDVLPVALRPDLCGMDRTERRNGE